MDPSTTELDELRARCEKAQAALGECVEALRPFAAMHREGQPASEIACQRGISSDATFIFSSDFTIARAALAQAQAVLKGAAPEEGSKDNE